MSSKAQGTTDTDRRLNMSARFAAVPVRCGPFPQRARAAFTLIELLVVLAIIGILAAMLLPALTKVKSRALSLSCLNNLKQLQVCWHMYALDNRDCGPPNNFVYDIFSQQPIDQSDSWCTNLAPFQADPSGIRNGLLFRYNESISIYHCPADKSTVQSSDPAADGQLRLRSYNMSQSLNGLPYTWLITVPSHRKFTAIKNPSKLFAFIDVQEDEILDTLFGIPLTNDMFYGYWFDIPANRHDQGANFSFADGHVEHWKWKVPKKFTVPRGFVQPVTPEEMPDYNRMQTGFLQSFDDQ